MALLYQTQSCEYNTRTKNNRNRTTLIFYIIMEYYIKFSITLIEINSSTMVYV